MAIIKRGDEGALDEFEAELEHFLPFWGTPIHDVKPTKEKEKSDDDMTLVMMGIVVVILLIIAILYAFSVI